MSGVARRAARRRADRRGGRAARRGGVEPGLAIGHFPINRLTAHKGNGLPCATACAFATEQTGLQEMLTVSERIDGGDAKPPSLLPTHTRHFTRRSFDVL
jgi:hypothetical protein